MKNTRIFAIIAISVLLLAGFAGMGGQVSARPGLAQATMAATAPASFNLKVVLQHYLTSLPGDFYGISPVDALKAMQADPKPYVVDLRETKEFGDGGYIAGSVNIPLPTLTNNLDKLPGKDSYIIVYCGVGHRGAMALMTLRLLGYTNVRSIFGGFNSWKAAKLPIEQGAPSVATKTGAAVPDFDPELFTVLDKFISGLPADFYAVSPTAALKSFQDTPNPVRLDVREPNELVAKGYIEGMINVPLRKLFDNLDQLPKQMDAPIIAYCAIGHRGAMAMMTLRLLGYTNVNSIGGGFNSWVSNGLPIVNPAPVTPAATAAS